MDKNNNIQKQSRKFSFSLRLIIIGLLILIFLIPLGLIQSLIKDRQAYRNDTFNEVTALWGKSQYIGGPVLTIPYVIHQSATDEQGNRIVRSYRQYAHFLPDSLSVQGIVTPEIRYRGIFKVPLYKTRLALKGNFKKPNFDKLNIPTSNIIWEDAFVSIGIHDVRGINEQITLNWNGTEAQFEPENMAHSIYPTGLSTPVTLSDSFEFSLNMDLSGSKMLKFLPIGNETTVSIMSPWTDPKFLGAFLPSERTISKTGFTSTWKISRLGRNYPQQWVNDDVRFHSKLSDSAFGVELLFPINIYQITMRSAKYGILFVFLTFLAFVLFEVINKTRIHPMQYLLVGFALCLFYLLLLSLSEHISFAMSYIIAAFSCISLVTLYSHSVLKKISRTCTLSFILVCLYVYLYILLQLQDLALLMGSVGLFVILTIIMFITRRIDWYMTSR